MSSTSRGRSSAARLWRRSACDVDKERTNAWAGGKWLPAGAVPKWEGGMANVLLTTKCNLHCTYCFAQEKMRDSRNQTMSLEDVAKVIEFLKRSGHPVFRAMGGEPTLHPQFPRILQMALEAGMRVDVLSNATWPESYNAVFQRVSPRHLFFLLNIDRPENYPPKIWERIESNLASVAAGGNVTLSFNIFETEPRYEYILELARKYRIDKVRMSFSLPVVGAENACLKLEHYKRMGPFVVEFARRAEESGIEARMDNVVPLCMFSPEHAGELLLKGIIDLKRNARCDPIVDIGPDLRVWCCFCLSKLWNRRLDEFQNLQEIQAYYRQAMSLYQGRLFAMDECYRCRYRDLWGCQGGCLTFAVMKHGELAPERLVAKPLANRLEKEPAQPESDGWEPAAILTLSPNVEIQHFDLPEDSYAVFDKASGVEMEVGASFQPLLSLLNGRYSAEEVVDRFVGSGPESQIQGLVGVFAEKAMKQGAQELLTSLLHRGFLVEQQDARARSAVS
jgi:MoaA/NifB/PqqE/SkfB family radical SAM enzyme